MSFTTRKKASFFLFTLVSLMLATQAVLAVPQEARALPNPVAIYIGPEYFQQGGKQWTRYKLLVTNYDAYPNELFAPAPNLPPCGANTNASRTWVEILDSNGKRIYGFCAMKTREDLTKLWFALETETIPPSWVVVVLNDRQTGKTYKSNLIDTVE
ncbi:MAG TPA: hypothetical protein VF553_15560 [Pyrinomonadaceae bacterium]